LTDQSTIVDDTIIFQLEEYDYLAVVNAGMGNRVAQHLTIYKGNREVEDSAGKCEKSDDVTLVIIKIEV